MGGSLVLIGQPARPVQMSVSPVKDAISNEQTNEVEKTLNADLTLFSTDMCTSTKHTYTYIYAQRSFSQKQRDGGALLIYIKISVFASFIA